MKRMLVTSLALAALLVPAVASAAAPATFAIDSSGFDFTDTSLTTGYIGFVWNGDQLQVEVTSGTPVDGIPAIQLWVPASTSDAAGNTVYPTITSLSDITLGSYGNRVDSVAVTHPDVGLGTVVSDYLATFRQLGFTASLQDGSTSNLAVYTLVNGKTTLRAVFHRNGADVTALVSGLTPS